MTVSATTPVRLRRRVHRFVVGGRILLRLGDRQAQVVPLDAVRIKLFDLLCAGTSRAHLVATVSELYDAATGDEVGRTLDGLYRGGFLERLDVAHHLPVADVRRFDRMLDYLSQWETPERTRFDGLAALRAARVTIIGTGGLGSWIIYNLLCFGIGHLKLIDGDNVEPSNLNRSILYDESQIGHRKVDAARETALRFAPRTTIETVDRFVAGADSILADIAGQDLVIATADQPPWEIRQWIADACVAARVPLLHPSGLHVGPFYLPGRDTACPMCEWALLVDHNPRQAEVLIEQRRLPAGDPGAMSHVGTITGGLVALEAFRFLTGTAEPVTVGGVWEMDDKLRSAVRPVERHPSCGVCGIGDSGTGIYRIPSEPPRSPSGQGAT